MLEGSRRLLGEKLQQFGIGVTEILKPGVGNEVEEFLEEENHRIAQPAGKGTDENLQQFGIVEQVRVSVYEPVGQQNERS